MTDMPTRRRLALGPVLASTLLVVVGIATGLATSERPARDGPPADWSAVLTALVPTAFVGDRLYWHVALTSGATAGIAPFAAWLAGWSWIRPIVLAFTIFPSRAISPPTARTC